MNNIRQIENDLYNRIDQRQMDIDIDELQLMAIQLMKLIEITKLPGVTKKDIVIKVLVRLVESHSSGLMNGQKDTVIWFIKNRLPFIIDALILVANHGLSLKKLKGKKCWCY